MVFFMLGMITLLRPPNLLVAIFPVLFGVNDKELWKRKTSEVFKRPLRLIAGKLLFLIPGVPAAHFVEIPDRQLGGGFLMPGSISFSVSHTWPVYYLASVQGGCCIHLS
jgi:hypothetical protein